MKLDCNKVNEKRMKALNLYREQLDHFQHKGLQAIKYLTEKGEALESWQQVLA
jgi:hypothetical protein